MSQCPIIETDNPKITKAHENGKESVLITSNGKYRYECEGCLATTPEYDTPEEAEQLVIDTPPLTEKEYRDRWLAV